MGFGISKEGGNLYSETAIQLRRCTAIRIDRQPCNGWSAWGDPTKRCGPHGGRATSKTRATCGCAAYRWKHRPAGGLCRWPGMPERVRTTPLGTRGIFSPRNSVWGQYAWLARWDDFREMKFVESLDEALRRRELQFL